MEDITPLNLEDHPKLFGMRYDQLIAILASSSSRRSFIHG